MTLKLLFFNTHTFILSTLLILTCPLQAQNILLDEGFDDLEISNDWEQQTGASDGGWIIGDNSSLQSEWWSIQAHGNFIATNDDQCNCNKNADYLMLPSHAVSLRL